MSDFLPSCRYRSLALISPVVYAPFYVFAIYAFINQREWIKIPGMGMLILKIGNNATLIECIVELLGLCWSWGMLIVMAAVMTEQFIGEYSTKNAALLCVGYLPYILFPLLFSLRLLIYPNVFKTSDHEKRS